MKTVMLAACMLVTLAAGAAAFVDDQQPKGTGGTVQRGAPPHVPTIFRAPRKQPANGKVKPAPPAKQPPASGRGGGKSGSLIFTNP